MPLFKRNQFLDRRQNFIVLLNRFADMLLPAFKRLAFLIGIIALACSTSAQQIHFVYLQTEGAQPFYVKINNKVSSSSSAGYLILPKLADGTYKLSIGFPKKEFPEENFQISVDKSNRGFLVKNFGEKGWGLFDMQSFAVVMGGNSDTTASVVKNLQEDPFSRMLANVVKDSSILQKAEPIAPSLPKAERKDSTLAARDSGLAKLTAVSRHSDSLARPIDSSVVRRDTLSAKVDSSVVAVQKPQPVAARRFFNKRNKDGRELIYIDRDADRNDTVRIFIPALKPVVKNNVSDTVQTTAQKNTGNASSDSVVATLPSPLPKTDTVVNAPSLPQSKTDSEVVAKSSSLTRSDTGVAISGQLKSFTPGDSSYGQRAPQKTALPVIRDTTHEVSVGHESAKQDEMVVLPKVVQSASMNSDCKAFASNEDFLKLRKRMASENSDDNMIKMARKVLHSRCFSTEQIKNLSFLFLTNEGKYRFFDSAYPFASDSDQYYTLQSQLTDSYYLNRFKAMIHK
jgi:Domain of unknown function (DUF4476)